MKARDALLLVLKTGIAAGLIWWLIQQDLLDIAQVKAMPFLAEFYIGICILLFSLALQVIRWQVLLSIQGITASYMRVARWTFVGEMFAFSVPGVGSEVARGYYVIKYAPNAKTAGLSTLPMDRLLGLFSLLLVAAPASVAIYFGHEEVNPFIATLAFAIISLSTIGTVSFLSLGSKTLQTVLLWPVPERWADIIRSILIAYSQHMGSLFKCLAISIVSQLCYCALFVIAAMAIDVSMPAAVAAFTVPTVMVANTLPLAPAGLGVGETVSAFLFSQNGVLSGATIMLIVRLWLFVPPLIGALTYVLGNEGRVQTAQLPNTEKNA